MGACASCLGLSSSSSSTDDERANLLDPSSVLDRGHPGNGGYGINRRGGHRHNNAHSGHHAHGHGNGHGNGGGDTDEDPEEIERAQEALAAIVDRVQGNLVDIQSLNTLLAERHPHSNGGGGTGGGRSTGLTAEQRKEKARQFTVLLNRILVAEPKLAAAEDADGADGTAAHDDEQLGEGADDDKDFKIKPVGDIVVRLGKQ